MEGKQQKHKVQVAGKNDNQFYDGSWHYYM